MKLVFIADEFKLRTPVQQLLDRFLIGHPGVGTFHKPDCRVSLVVPKSNEDVERRIKDFGLTTDSAGADGTLLFSPSKTIPAQRSFVYGSLPRTAPAGTIAGTATRGAFHLPAIHRPKNARLTKALAVVQGPYPSAEIEALEALLPLIWSDSKVRKVTFLGPKDFWPVLKRDFWPLLKSAISRSDSPQGDPVRDGRTQDLAGLGLLESLAERPRGWLIEQQNGLVFVLAVLDGVVNDYNVALQTASGGITSAQVYRPPAPAEHHYSRLAAALERFFRTGVFPWPVEQNLLTMELLNRFDQERALKSR